MIVIYFVRHAQSEANQKQVYAGSGLDPSLTDEGRDRFKAMSVKNKIHFDKIYTSSLKRSIESANILKETLPYPVEVVHDSRINEIHFGKLTGQPYRDLSEDGIRERFDIESNDRFSSRVISFYDEIKQTDEDILIIGHVGVARILNTIIHDGPTRPYDKDFDVKSYTIYQL